VIKYVEKMNMKCINGKYTNVLYYHSTANTKRWVSVCLKALSHISISVLISADVIQVHLFVRLHSLIYSMPATYPD
jgi:predicted membrane channel-forming protein YqfA (hemolysin III family)